MTHHQRHHDHAQAGSHGFWTSRAFLAFLGFAAMAMVLLWEEHRAHILGVLPFLFLLACPLMHIFMHGGHTGHRHNQRYDDTGRNPSQPDGGQS